jgi:hypothetical protein
MRQRTLIVQKYAVIGLSVTGTCDLISSSFYLIPLLFVFYSPFARIQNETTLIVRVIAPEIGDLPVKIFLRIALTVAIIAALAPIALAAGAPGGGAPQPQVDAALTTGTTAIPWWIALIAAFLSWLRH